MSFVNVQVTRDHAFVAVDTLALQSAGTNAGAVVRLGGGLVHFSKLLTLPHARSLVASNGCSTTTELVFSACQRVGFAELDEGVGLMPQIIRSAVESTAKMRGTTASDPDVWHVAFYLVGWSERRQRMGLHCWWFDGAPEAQETHLWADNPGQVISMHIMGDALRGRLPQTAAEFAELTRASVAIEHAKEQPHAVGGTLIVADITPDSIALHHCGDLGLPPCLRLVQTTTHSRI